LFVDELKIRSSASANNNKRHEAYSVRVCRPSVRPSYSAWLDIS